MTPDDDTDDMVESDPGLAGERTELAWTRTTISFAALGGAVLKERPVVGLITLGISGLVHLIGRMSRPRLRITESERRSLLVLITTATTVVCAGSLAILLLGATNLR